MIKYEQPKATLVAFESANVIATSLEPEVLLKSGANLGELDSQTINLFS